MKKAFKPTNVFAAADVIVIGRDPEMADYTNPKGLIYGYAAFIVAEDAVGNRKSLPAAVSSEESEALGVARGVIERINTIDDYDFGAWADYRPAYGSDAYDPLADIEWERRVEEDERWY